MPTLAITLKKQLKAARQQAIEVFQSNHKTEQLLAQLRRNVDEALTQAWEELGMSASAALVAVGGYGRGELFPHSDVDVLILLDQTPDAATKEKLESLVQLFWDIGLEIGHSIRTVDECLDESAADITVQTSLLEARLVTGSRTLFRQLQERYQAALDPLAFFQAKTLEMRQRHVKYEDTPYSLEPNCKESPGGLRDLQLILWVTEAAAFGSSWRELDQRGLITGREARELRRNEAFLKTLRARLHVIAGRRQDILVFDLQTAVAQSFGYEASATRRASELLMRRYYWAAKAVTQLATILIQNIEAQLFPSTSGVTRVLSDRFVEKQGMIEIASDDVFEREPHAILEAFLLYEQVPGVKGLSARTLRALYNARDTMDQRWRRDPENRRQFMEILKQPSGITHAMRLMNQTSVLGRYLLNFRRIVGQMQHDLYHMYTVDQHILMVLRNMRRFAVVEHAHEYPFCSQLIANFERPWVLYVAALFHDIAKGRGGDHSVLGEEDARGFCAKLGLRDADIDLIAWLVRWHLVMSVTAQRQDITDPDVVHRFAVQVEDVERLDHLYLLTIADIAGTNPKLWNAWKDQLLADLYVATRYALRAGLERPPHAAARIAACRDAALKQLVREGIEAPRVERLWSAFPEASFLRQRPNQIARQTRAILASAEPGAPVVVVTPSARGGSEVFVHARDRDGLFAALTATLDRHGVSVAEARVFSSQGIAFDTFVVLDAETQAPLDAERAARLEAELAGVLGDNAMSARLVRRILPRRLRHFRRAPRVELTNTAEATQLALVCGDQPGLLAQVAQTLRDAHVRVHDARIATFGERAEDFFVISDESDRPLSDAAQQALRAALEERFGVEDEAPKTAAVSADT